MPPLLGRSGRGLWSKEELKKGEVKVGTGKGNRGSEGTGAAHQASRPAKLAGGQGEGNGNKGENSLWFGSPVGPAVFFPHVPRPRQNIISTAWGSLQMEFSADLCHETSPAPREFFHDVTYSSNS